MTEKLLRGAVQNTHANNNKSKNMGDHQYDDGSMQDYGNCLLFL